MQPDEKTQKAAEVISQVIDTQDDTVELDTASVVAPPDGDETEGQPDDPPPPAAGGEPEPPKAEPAKAEGPELTSNHKVIILIVGAVVLFALGIILSVVGSVLAGVGFILVAALLVLIAVFLPIK